MDLFWFSELANKQPQTLQQTFTYPQTLLNLNMNFIYPSLPESTLKHDKPNSTTDQKKF